LAYTTKLTIYRAHSLIPHVQLITVISTQWLTRHSQLVTRSNRHNGQLVTKIGCDELAVWRFDWHRPTRRKRFWHEFSLFTLREQISLHLMPSNPLNFC